MKPFWTGSVLSRQGDPDDAPEIRLYNGEQGIQICAKSTLQLLSFVDCSLIPLHIICGPAYEVMGPRSWVHDVILESLPQRVNERGHACLSWPMQSDLGALLRIDHASSERKQEEAAKITELLIYAKTENTVISETNSSPTRSSERSDPLTVRFFALPLSSHLLYQPSKYDIPPTPPSEASCTNSNGTFLQPLGFDPSTRRRRLDDLFEGASKARKRPKCQESSDTMTMAASTGRSPLLPEGERGEAHCDMTKTARPHSRAQSLSSMHDQRPVSRGSVVERARSSLSRIASAGGLHRSDSKSTEVTNLSQPPSTPENKNKKTLSNMVMASMRLRGMSQRRGDAEDSEYKLIYHNTFKAANFALRAGMQVELRPDSMRDVVDLLLDLFCGVGSDDGGSGSFDMSQKKRDGLDEEKFR